MKNRSLIMLVLFVFLIACNKDDESQKEFTAATEDIVQTEMTHPLINYVAPDLPVINSRSNGNRVTRTIKVFSSKGTNWIEGPSDCPTGSVRIMIQGEGIVSHLGRTTGYGTFCVDEFGNPTTELTITEVAANGDELYSSPIFVGVGDDPPHNPDHADYPYHEDYIYVDGTGRFVGVTGEVTLFGEVVLPTLEEPGSYDFWGEGTITY